MTATQDKRAAAAATLGAGYAPLGGAGVSPTDAAGIVGLYGGMWEAGTPVPPDGFLVRYHLYVAGVFATAPTPEDEDMLDFESLGGVYNDSSSGARAANTSALNSYLAAVSRPAVRFGGPRNSSYGNGRVPGAAYFNASIVVPGLKPVIIDGGNCVIDFNTISGVIPAIDVGEGGAGIERIIKDFRLNTPGSGICLDAPGRGTVVQNIRIYPTGVGTVALDDFSDSATAPYGLAIVDGAGTSTPDGVRIEGVQIFDAGGHGFFIPDGLNAGTIMGRVHNADGTGFKAQKLQGCDVGKVVSESNYGWGFHLEKCGTGICAGGLSGGLTDIPNDGDFWLENNNRRGSPYAANAHRVRQARIRNCGALKIKGHTGWGSNKFDIDEGSRNNCIFESGRWINCPNANPEVAITTGTHVLPDASASAASNNLQTVWTNPTYRPSVDDLGDEFTITIPAGCFDNVNAGTYAYWRPWGLASLFTSAPDDMVYYEVDISGDANLVAWCVGREEMSNPRQSSDICQFQVAPISGGQTWPGLYNTQRRKFSGRVALGEVRADVSPEIILWSTGMQDQSGGFPQNQALTLTIHTWKFYVKRADGSAV